MRDIVTTITDWNQTVWVFLTELLRILCMVHLRGNVTTKLAKACCALECDMPVVPPFFRLQILQVFVASFHRTA